MSSTSLFVAEFVLTAVLVLGFCAHQIRSLNRLSRDRAARKKAEDRPPDG
jgi:hypothetical protein